MNSLWIKPSKEFFWIFGVLWTTALASDRDSCKCTIIDARKSCYCTGNFTTFPPIPMEEIERLYMSRGRLRGINGSSLSHFGTYLRELSVTHMPEFTFIDHRALEDLPMLKYMRISHTGMSRMPTLKGLGRAEPLNIICLEYNKIQDIQASGVRSVELLLGYNDIKIVKGWVFNGSEIHKLSLRGNQFLSHLSYHSFSGIKKLKELDLSDTSVSCLPPSGLRELEVLKMTNSAVLQTVSTIYDMERLQRAWRSLAAHCCAFQQSCITNTILDKEGRAETTVPLTVAFQQSTNSERSTFAKNRPISVGVLDDNSNGTTIGPPIDVCEYHVHMRGTSYPTVPPTSQWDVQQMCNCISERNPVDCWPKLDVLDNCEDLITSTWVKGSVWVVLLIALIGNVLVLIIVTLSRSEKTVARFLTGNLAFADLCMAVYLFLVATMDAISSKAYYNYAYLWQQGVGCKVAGFLTIFSCQLSFFTLSLLTVERWFSIKRALYSNLLDTKITTMIMTCGWFYSLLMATLPLLGVSSYSSASICLPMEIHDFPSLIYICVLLGSGGVAFLLMCFCYTQIYLSLRQETRHPKGGRSVARKIFILVATNFFCWSPIAFFALAAVTGHPLISITKSKALLLFIYPINSCANPYLYVIMTKQFKKDLIMLLARYGLCTHIAEQYRMNYSRPMSHETYQTTVNSTRSFVV
uniref:Thyrotropin receptor n=1 Tax=Lygus hesperus TaxID=30085 RepID=A0A0A9WHR4_LYGHE